MQLILTESADQEGKAPDPLLRIAEESETLSVHGIRFGEVTIPALPSAEPLRLECQHFIQCVENRTQPRSDARDGLRVVRVLDAAQRSLEAGGNTIKLS